VRFKRSGTDKGRLRFSHASHNKDGNLRTKKERLQLWGFEKGGRPKTEYQARGGGRFWKKGQTLDNWGLCKVRRKR